MGKSPMPLPTTEQRSLEGYPEAGRPLVDVSRLAGRHIAGQAAAVLNVERVPGDQGRGGQVERDVRCEAVGETQDPLVAEIAFLTTIEGVRAGRDPVRQRALRVHLLIRPTDVGDRPEREG